jgi:hypothetical protein
MGMERWLCGKILSITITTAPGNLMPSSEFLYTCTHIPHAHTHIHTHTHTHTPSPSPPYIHIKNNLFYVHIKASGTLTFRK